MLKLLENTDLVEKLLVGLQDGLAIVNPQGEKIFVNDALCELTGFSREELLGKTAPFPYWPAEEIPIISEAFHRTLSGDKKNLELVFCNKQGERFPVLVSPSRLADTNGDTVAFIATVKDIRKWEQLERAARESEQRWRSIAENPFDFVTVIDRSYKYLYVNHTAPGINADDLIGKATPFDFTAPAYHAIMKNAFDTAFNHGRAVSYDVYADSLDKWYSTIVGPIHEQGQINSISLLTRDITEQKLAEESLRKSENQLRENHKTETIGTLASGIAHDLNNTLTPILVYSGMLLSESPAIEEHLHGKINAINQAATRARDLVQRILLFSRQQEPMIQTIDYVDIVRESAKLFTATASTTIDIQVDLPDHPLWIQADKTQIDQVIANLITNALFAMQDCGSTLRISLSQQKSCSIVPDTTCPSECAVLTIRDSGIGMDEETKRRAFDPFFTTKPPGSGTGLGLSIVQGIIREHFGAINLDSQLGQGTTCTIVLPLADATLAERHSQKEAQQRSVTSLHILCVDDEPLVADAVETICCQHGHRITAVNNGNDALTLLTNRPDAFDLIITDNAMPRMSGIELIRHVRALTLTIPCIMMTGIDDEKCNQEAQGLSITQIIKKPFTAEALLTSIEQV